MKKDKSTRRTPKPKRELGWWDLIVALGVFVCATGIAWPWLVPPRALLSEADAIEYGNAAEALHASTEDHDHGTDHGAGHDTSHGNTHERMDNAAARERFAKALQKQDRALFARDWAGRIVFSVGALLVIFGGLKARQLPEASRG